MPLHTLASALLAATTSAVSPALPIDVIRTRLLNYNGFTYTSSVVPASAASPALPPVVLLPPIGVGIDRTFCRRLLEAWAIASPSATLHAIDVIGMGDSSPKPRMKRRLLGGWEEPPRTPREWAEQVVAYITEEVGEPCVVVGQSNLCTVALEAAALDPEAVKGVVLLGPPAVEALSLDKSPEAIAKVWRIVGSPVGAALFRFARRKPFLASFSKKNLFADPALVDDDYLDVCAAGAADAATRHAVFSFVAGTWRQDYRPLLAALATPTLVLSGSDVGAAAAAGGGVGRGEEGQTPPAPPAAEGVDRTSIRGLLRWFAVWRSGRDQGAGSFAQVGRDLGLDPEAKLRDYEAAMPAAVAAGALETSLLPGWNVLVWESPADLAAALSGFVRRRFGDAAPPSAAAPTSPSLRSLLPVGPVKARLFRLAARTAGGAAATAADLEEVREVLAELEARNPTPRAASSALLDGEWDQCFTNNPAGGVVWSDGRTARRKLLGPPPSPLAALPLTGRVTQLVDLSVGEYRQRVQSRALGLRAELRAAVAPTEDGEAWEVAFRSFTFSAAAGRLPLRARETSGYEGVWRHSYVDADTRVMRTRKKGADDEWVFVLRRAVT